MKTINKMYDVLLAMLLACAVIAIIGCVFGFSPIYSQISSTTFLIITFIAMMNRKNIISAETLTTENAFLIATISIFLIGFIFSSFFLLGRYVIAYMI